MLENNTNILPKNIYSFITIKVIPTINKHNELKKEKRELHLPIKYGNVIFVIFNHLFLSIRLCLHILVSVHILLLYQIIH